MMIKIKETTEIPGHPEFVADGIYVVSDDTGRLLVGRGQAMEVMPDKPIAQKKQEESKKESPKE